MTSHLVVRYIFNFNILDGPTCVVFNCLYFLVINSEVILFTFLFPIQPIKLVNDKY